MMEWLARSLHSRSKTKTAILTLFCLSAILVLLETWRSDSWSLIVEEYNDLGSIAKGDSSSVESFVGDGSNMPSGTLSEDAQDGNVEGTTGSTDATANSTMAPELFLNTRPAIVAGGMKATDIEWMQEFEDS